MGEKERPSSVNHSERADHIQDSMPPVSSTHASTRNDERVSMSPRAEADVFVREQHSSQTQSATSEREASSVDLREFRGLKKQVRILTEERNELLEENSQLRVENQELQAENQELKEKEDKRSKQNTEATARWREKHPEKDKAYKREYMREYMRKRRAEQKKQA